MIEDLPRLLQSPLAPQNSLDGLASRQHPVPQRMLNRMQLADAAMVEDLPRLLESLLDAPDPELRASAAFALGALLPAETSAAATAQQQQPDAGGHPPELSPQQHEVGEALLPVLSSPRSPVCLAPTRITLCQSRYRSQRISVSQSCAI